MHDAIIIGGSFAGLSAALQLARARRGVLVIDSGLPRNRFAEHAHGFLGQDGRPPYDILREASRQLALYPTVTRMQGEARNARRDEDGFSVTLADGREERAARLVLATGVRDELPPIPGVRERWGRTVVHCPYCHGYEVADRELGVIATSPLSVHQAAMLPDWGPTTYFTQGVFEPDAEQAAHLAARSVRLERTPVVELLGTAPALHAARLSDGRTVPLGAVFVGSRTEVAGPLAAALGCELEEGPMGHYLKVDAFRQTSVPGVYAAGDAANAMQNATVASASGVLAGVGAHQSLVAENIRPAAAGVR